MLDTAELGEETITKVEGFFERDDDAEPEEEPETDDTPQAETTEEPATFDDDEDDEEDVEESEAPLVDKIDAFKFVTEIVESDAERYEPDFPTLRTLDEILHEQKETTQDLEEAAEEETDASEPVEDAEEETSEGAEQIDEESDVSESVEVAEDAYVEEAEETAEEQEQAEEEPETDDIAQDEEPDAAEPVEQAEETAGEPEVVEADAPHEKEEETVEEVAEEALLAVEETQEPAAEQVLTQPKSATHAPERRPTFSFGDFKYELTEPPTPSDVSGDKAQDETSGSGATPSQESISAEAAVEDISEQPVLITPSHDTFTIKSPKLVVPPFDRSGKERSHEPKSEPVQKQAPPQVASGAQSGPVDSDEARRREVRQQEREAKLQAWRREQSAEKPTTALDGSAPQGAPQTEPQEEATYQPPKLAHPPELEEPVEKQEKAREPATFTRIASGEREAFSLEAPAPPSGSDHARAKSKPLPTRWDSLEVPKSKPKPVEEEFEEYEDEPREEPRELGFLGKIARSLQNLFKSVNQ